MDNKNLDLSQFDSLDEIQVEDNSPQFARTPAYIVCDKSISGNAKAIMSYVILRKDAKVIRNGELREWEFVKENIIENMKEGPKAVTNAFDNLINRGYLIQSKEYKHPKTGANRRVYKFFVDPADNPFYDGELPVNEFYEKEKKKKEKAATDITPEQPKGKQTNTNKSFNNNVSDNKRRTRTSRKIVISDNVGMFDLDGFD